MKINDVEFQDKCVIPLTTFEKKGINCYGKIPLDDRLSPEIIKMFPKERFATLYRSVRLSDYLILNATYEQLSVMTVRMLQIYSFDLLEKLHDKFYNHKENTMEYAIDVEGTLYEKPDADPLYKKIEKAILEKQKKAQKVKKQLEVIEKANSHIKNDDYVYTPVSETHYLFNISNQSYIKLIKTDENLKKLDKITVNNLLLFLNLSYNSNDIIYKFERLYRTSDIEERYNYQFRGSTLFSLLKGIPYITIFSKKYYRETDILKFDKLMYERYAVLPQKD